MDSSESDKVECVTVLMLECSKDGASVKSHKYLSHPSHCSSVFFPNLYNTDWYIYWSRCHSSLCHKIYVTMNFLQVIYSFWNQYTHLALMIFFDRSFNKHALLEFWQLNESEALYWKGENSTFLPFQGKRFHQQTSCTVLSSPASSCAAKTQHSFTAHSAAQRLWAQAQSHELWIREIFLDLLFNRAAVLDSVLFFGAELRRARWSGQCRTKPNRTPRD